MSFRPWVALVVLVAVPRTLPAAPILSDIRLGQFDFRTSDGVLRAPNSVWGYLEFLHVPDPTSTYFLNVTAAQSGPPTAWVVQNMPLFSAALNGTERLAVDINLEDIGIANGTDLSTMSLQFSLDSTVRGSAPTGGGNVFAVEDMLYFSYDDVAAPEPGIASNDPGKPEGVKNQTAPASVTADRDIRALQEEALRCFPGSVARSLDWLNRTHTLGFPSQDQIYKDVRDKVAGHVEKDKIRLKAEYARQKRVKTKIHDTAGFFAGGIPGVPRTAPADESLLDWLKREIKTEDIEFAYYWEEKNGEKFESKAHIITVVRMYITADGKVMVRFRDDETQGDDTKGDTAIKERALYLKDGVWRFGSDDDKVYYAMSESVPEPVSLVLFSLGFAGLLVRRRLTH